MTRRSVRTVPTVVVPGWNGSGPDHWQTWLEDRSQPLGRPTVRPAFADLDHPDRDEWLAALRATIAVFPDDGYDVVAHSLGAVLWLHHAQDPGDSPRAARVLLVAPPSPGTQVAGVASDDDPYLPQGIAAAYGLPLKIATTIVPGAAHLNSEAGYGEWPAVLDWCGRDNLAFY